MFPIYEIIDGHELNILYRPKNVIPVEEYLAAQGRYKHLFKPENRPVLEAIQKEGYENWEKTSRKRRG